MTKNTLPRASITRSDKRHLFEWLVKTIGNRTDVTTKHMSNNTFILIVGKSSIELPYDYWTEWTLGEIVDYTREVIL